MSAQSKIRRLAQLNSSITMGRWSVLYVFQLFCSRSIIQTNAFSVHISSSSDRTAIISSSRIAHFASPIRYTKSRPWSSVTKLWDSNDDLDRDAPNVRGKRSKTFKEKKFIEKCLQRNELFSNLTKPSLNDLVDAFEKTQLPRDYIIFNQGDGAIGDYIYMISDGKCTIEVDGKVIPEPYGILSSTSIFGELAVLYDQPRAATITVQSESVTLFRVDGPTFKDILKKPKKDLQKMEQIDGIINEVEGSKELYSGNIIPPYQPERLWLWKQVDGTILSLSLKTTFLNVLFSLIFVMFVKYQAAEYHGDVFVWNFNDLFQQMVPEKDVPVVQQLSLINEIWQYQKNLTTFVLTFFLSQAFSFWRHIYETARQVQDSLDTFHLLLAANAKREDNGTPTTESQILMEDIGQYSRLLHIFLWASLAKRYEVLTTPIGLERMSSRGLMSPKQLDVLVSLDVPGDQLFFAPLEWMLVRTNKAMDEDILPQHPQLRGELNRQTCLLKNHQAEIGSKLSGRMPLAYVHLVQILVDTFVLIAPFALYPDLGAYSPIAVGILTFFYAGSLDLSKVFLDPLNNEEFCEESIFMDLSILIRESNAGSVRWSRAGSKLPF